METMNKEVIEKKTYVDNDHYRRNNGFGMGLAGVITGSVALANQLVGGRGLFGFGGGGNTPDIINNNTNTNTASGEAPTAFQAWEKSCDEILALTNALWASKTDTLSKMYAHRETDVSEKFGLYKTSRDLYDVLNDKVTSTAFENYKFTRDGYDAVMARISALEKEVAVGAAVRPYQDKLIQSEIDRAFTAAITHADRLDCRNIKGVVTLPNTPTITGFQSQRCGCPQAQTQAA